MREKPAASRWPLLAGAVLVVAIAGAYANSLAVPFQFDDGDAIVENGTIRALWPLSAPLSPQSSGGPVAGRPLVNLSFAINYAFGGLDVRGYHVVNIAIHVVCALLLFEIVRRTLRKLRGAQHADTSSTMFALACAAIWALHPIHTGSVTYLSARTESLASLFYLLTLLAGIRAPESARGRAWAAAAIAACALGMACKETMITAPVMMVLYDRAFVFDGFRSAFAARWRFYAGLAATLLVLVALNVSGPRAESAGFSAGISPWTYLLNQGPMLVEYLRVSLWPDGLIFAYGEPIRIELAAAAPSLALVAALLALTVWGWFTAPKVAFLGVWFFLTLAPSSSVVPIATEVGADRRMYLPLAGLVVLAIVAVRAAWHRVTAREGAGGGAVAWRAGAAAAAIVAVALAVLTYARNRDYMSADTLWRTSLERWPSAIAHRNYATVLRMAGRRDEALDHLRLTIADHPEVRYAIGAELFELGRFDEALRELREFLRGEPSGTNVARDARFLIGRSLAAQGKSAEAVEEFAGILRDRPGDAPAQLALGDALLARKDFTGAIEAYRRYLQGRPDDVGALTNAGVALLSAGAAQEAAGVFQRAVAREPRNASAHLNLAIALEALGRAEDAAVHAREAVTLRPGDPNGHDAYARLLLLLDRRAEARDHFERVLQLDATRADVRAELERLR